MFGFIYYADFPGTDGEQCYEEMYDTKEQMFDGLNRRIELEGEYITENPVLFVTYEEEELNAYF